MAAQRKSRSSGTQAGSSQAKSVEEVIAGYPDDTQKLARQLRQIVMRAVPEATEAVKWGMPVFEHHGSLCYLQGQKGYLRFGLYRPTQLDDPEGLLEGTGKTMRHVKVRSEEDIHPIFATWLRQIAAINEG